jgi:formate hydrogenlyase subunit 4
VALGLKILQVATILLLPPLLIGIIHRTKASFAGRVGPPLLQAYFDLWRLFRKGSVFSTTTTWVFLAGPVVSLATSLLALALIPIGPLPALVPFTGDLILFAYLFALGRFFTVAAALDTGSAFEGMGGAREVTFACLAEPALLLSLIVLAVGSRTLSLSAMLGENLVLEWSTIAASLVVVLVSLFIVMLAENSRIPFDDPNTHLELTMIHEVMVLDHSGPAFGMILYGSSLKLFALAALIARIATPFSIGDRLFDLGVFVLATITVAVAIGIVESMIARLRMTQAPNLLIGACILSAFGIVLLAR